MPKVGGFGASTVKLVNEEHPSKVEFPILVTSAGTVISVNELHPLKIDALTIVI